MPSSPELETVNEPQELGCKTSKLGGDWAYWRASRAISWTCHEYQEFQLGFHKKRATRMGDCYLAGG